MQQIKIKDMRKNKKNKPAPSKEKASFLGSAGRNMTYRDLKRKAIVLGMPFPDACAAGVFDLIGYIERSTNKPDKSLIDQYDDWMDKYALLIDLGNSLPPLDEKYKTESNLIEGCQSRVWFQADYVDGKIIFQGESDAVIVKGIVSLLIQILSGHTPQEILDADLYFIDKVGLKEHLSPTRSNGLVAMVKQMRLYAMAYRAKEQQ